MVAIPGQAQPVASSNREVRGLITRASVAALSTHSTAAALAMCYFLSCPPTRAVVSEAGSGTLWPEADGTVTRRLLPGDPFVMTSPVEIATDTR